MTRGPPPRNAVAPSFGLTGPAGLPISASIEAPRYGGAFASGGPRRAGRPASVVTGGMSRAAKGADCKSAGYAFVGSSPTSPTTTLPIRAAPSGIVTFAIIGPAHRARARPRAGSGERRSRASDWRDHNRAPTSSTSIMWAQVGPATLARPRISSSANEAMDVAIRLSVHECTLEFSRSLQRSKNAAPLCLTM